MSTCKKEIQTDRALLPGQRRRHPLPDRHRLDFRFETTVGPAGGERRAGPRPIRLDGAGRSSRAKRVELQARGWGKKHMTKKEASSDLARTAVAHAIRLLDTRGTSPSSSTTTTSHGFETTPATPEAKTMALARLGEIDARGNTDLFGGWSRGANALTDRVLDERTRVGRVLLLTDGLANEGNQSGRTRGIWSTKKRANMASPPQPSASVRTSTRPCCRAPRDRGRRTPSTSSRARARFRTSSPAGSADAGRGRAPCRAHCPRRTRRQGSDVLDESPRARPQENMVWTWCWEIWSEDGEWGDRTRGAVATARRRHARHVDSRLTNRAGALFPQPMRVEWTTVECRT